jgi:hypothetical protein
MSKFKTELVTQKNIKCIYGKINKFFKSASKVHKRSITKVIWEIDKTESKNIKVNYDKNLLHIYISQKEKVFFSFCISLGIGDRIHIDGNKIVTQTKNKCQLFNHDIYIYTIFERK